MRHQLMLWIALLCFAALTGCGNANDGKAFTPYKKATSAVKDITVGNTNNTPLAKLLFCKDPLMVLGADFQTLFSGSTVCPSEGAKQNVRGSQIFFKVSSNMPVNARLCVVPFVGDNATQETCFAINGSAYVQLSTDQYSSIAIVSENNLGAYKSFLMDPAAAAPPRAIYSL